MNDELGQVSNLPSTHSKPGRYSLWLGVAGIVLCVVGRVFTYVMYNKNTPDIFRNLLRVIDEPVFFLGVICGLLAILMGTVAYRQNKKLGGERKDKAAQAGIVLGILAFIPFCLSVCGFVLLALATGSQVP